MRFFVFASLLTLTACIEGPAEITLGTGAETYAPLADGDQVDIIRGLQGGFHIWGAVRASRGLDPVQLEVEYHVLKNGRELSGEPTVVRVNLIGRGEYNEGAGMRGVVPNPQDIVGQEVVLKMLVTDTGGRTAESQRKVIPRMP